MDPLAQGAGGPRQRWLESRGQLTGLSTSRQVKPISFSRVGARLPHRPRIPIRADSSSSVFLTPHHYVQCSTLAQSCTLSHLIWKGAMAAFLSQFPTQAPRDKSSVSETVSPNLVPIPWPFVPTRAKRDRNPSGVNHCGEKRVPATCFSS